MKNDLISIINQIPSIELKFRHFEPSADFIALPADYIYDNPDFIKWLESVKYELQDIYDRTHDTYVFKLINSQGIVHFFDGRHHDEREHFNKLRSSLELILKNADKYYPTTEYEKGEKKMKKPMLFISHASADLLYVEPLVELFADIGLNKKMMFCSSVPDYHIPMDNDIYTYLRNLFTDYELHVIFILSHNYYQSTACLNEMGGSLGT